MLPHVSYALVTRILIKKDLGNIPKSLLNSVVPVTTSLPHYTSSFAFHLPENKLHLIKIDSFRGNYVPARYKTRFNSPPTIIVAASIIPIAMSRPLMPSSLARTTKAAMQGRNMVRTTDPTTS